MGNKKYYLRNVKLRIHIECILTKQKNIVKKQQRLKDNELSYYTGNDTQHI